MKQFGYYLRTSFETTVGIVVANNEIEAREILARHYPNDDATKWKIEEVRLRDSVCELYYGG